MQVGIAVDNTVPLHIPSFIEFIGAHSQAIHCCTINAPLRFSQSPIDYERESAGLNNAVRREMQGNDFSLLVTSLPFANNYFYIGRTNLDILSFSDWHLLTTLPMSNGLAYFLCQIILKYRLNIGLNHDETTGCINDFLWDKTGIDVGMRAAAQSLYCAASKARVDTSRPARRMNGAIQRLRPTFLSAARLGMLEQYF